MEYGSRGGLPANLTSRPVSKRGPFVILSPQAKGPCPVADGSSTPFRMAMPSRGELVNWRRIEALTDLPIRATFAPARSSGQKACRPFGADQVQNARDPRRNVQPGVKP